MRRRVYFARLSDAAISTLPRRVDDLRHAACLIQSAAALHTDRKR
jgi:hypothetical protein